MTHRTVEARATGVGPRETALVLSTLAIITLVVAVPTLDRLSTTNDIAVHVTTAPEIATGHGAISYSLWYPLLYWTSGASQDVSTLRVVAVVILTIAVLAKVLVAAAYALGRSRSVLASITVGLVALLAMPLPKPVQPEQIYLGQITPTVWHNATWILAAPFALLTFFTVHRLLCRPTRAAVVVASCALLVSTAAKPNFTLAFAPVVGVAILAVGLRRGEGLPALVGRSVAVLAPAAALMLLQYALTFGADGVVPTSLGVQPFAVWTALSASVPWSVLVSVVGPLSLLLALPRRVRSRTDVVLALSTLVVAVVQVAVFTERKPTGEPFVHGNFFWGSFSAMLIVMVVLTSALATAVVQREVSTSSLRLWVAGFLVAVQCATGVFYVTHAGIDGFPVMYREDSSPFT